MHVLPLNEIPDLSNALVDAFCYDPADLLIVAGRKGLFDPLDEVSDRGFDGHFFEHAAYSGSAATASTSSAASVVFGVVCEDVQLIEGCKLFAGLFGRACRSIASLANARGEILRPFRGFHVCPATRDRGHELRDVRHGRRKQVAEINDRRGDRRKDRSKCSGQAVIDHLQAPLYGVHRTVNRAADLCKVIKSFLDRRPEPVYQGEYGPYTDAVSDDVPQPAL